MAAAGDAWEGFNDLKAGMRFLTVEKLKSIITTLNDECGTAISKTAKKQDLVDRIAQQMDDWKLSNNTDKWTKAKAIVDQVRSNGTSLVRPAHHGSSYSTGKPQVSSGSFSGNASSSSGRYDPYTPRPMAGSSRVAQPSTTNTLRFKSSPFFKIESQISSVQECPESTHSQDRKSQALNFTLSEDVIAKLKSDRPKYQLRLYCTSSAYHSAGNGFRNSACPIEFPSTCEIRVNSVQLTGNFKGMKKKAGTAPPAELQKVRLSPGLSNTLELIYVNAAQNPTPNKKFYMVVNLVEVTSVTALVTRLRSDKVKSRDEILCKMKRNAVVDDDIEAGPQKMSLKCPLSYTRIQTPCRSSLCVHPQCFDATSWFSVMEQTTTWLCPVCEKVLNIEELIVDGYFDDILRTTPESVEEIMVEPDGEWHTIDGKYGSVIWMAAAREKRQNLGQSPAKPKIPTPPPADKPKEIPKGVEVVVLDSDDEDEGRVKRELSPLATGPPSSTASSHRRDADVIDLTLDSDDEPPAPPKPPAPSLKRKERPDDSAGQQWKRSRPDVPSSAPGAPPPAPNAPPHPQSLPAIPPHHPQSQGLNHPPYPGQATNGHPVPIMQYPYPQPYYGGFHPHLPSSAQYGWKP